MCAMYFEFVSEGEFVLFNNIASGTRLNLVNLEEERVRKVDFDFNSLFMSKRLHLPLVAEVKKSVINGKRLYMNPSKEILLAANQLNAHLWKSFKIQRVKIEDFVRNAIKDRNLVITIFALKIEFNIRLFSLP